MLASTPPTPDPPASAAGLRIAVIGAGVSGLSAAYLLSQRHEVALFERDRRLGGHAHTHRVSLAGREWALDSGFLVYNHRTYPRFVSLLEELGIEGQPSDMSFSVRCRRCKLEYASHSLDGLFAQRRRVADPHHLAMLLEVPRFNRKARALLDGPEGDDRTLAEFLAAHGFSRGFARHFLLPLVGAVWSSSHRDVSGFSARALFRFLLNHGWLTLDPPQWWTIGGGSARYVEALARRLGGRVHEGRAVEQVRRDPRGVEVTTEDGETRRFDRVVLATHADQALRLLADPSEDESRALAAFRYSQNRTLLHTDERSLPDSRRAWASWNMDLLDCQDPSRPLGMTYNVSRLQSLPGPATFCVSLNEPFPAPETVLAEMAYSHPILDAAATRAQKELRRLSGQRNTYYAGAHLRYGFHEDGLRSALAVAEALGCRLGAATASREEAA
jgi:predicted NAD/FAD-binding protein